MNDRDLGPWMKLYGDVVTRKAHYTDRQFRALITVYAMSLAGHGTLPPRRPLEALVGQDEVDFLLAEGDLDDLDGEMTIHGWSTYQSHDRTRDAERKRRQRERESQVSHIDVTRDVGVTSSSSSSSISKTFSEGDSFPAPAPARGELVYYPDGDRDSLDTYHELTGYRPWSTFSGEALRAAERDYRTGAVDEAMRFEYGRDGKRETLLKRTLAKLARDAERADQERVTTPKIVKPKMDEAAYQATRRRLAAEDAEALAKRRTEIAT